MAVYGGPKINNDGLILYLDPAFKNVYRGDPTINVVAYPIPTASWSVASYLQSTCSRDFLIEDGIPYMRLYNVSVVQVGYPRIQDVFFANSATISGVFSTSFEARGTPGAILTLHIYSNNSTKITNQAIIDSETEWKRYTFENQNTVFNLDKPYFVPRTSGAVYDIRNIQIEAKPYVTDFVSGTRGLTIDTGGGIRDISSFNNHATYIKKYNATERLYLPENKGVFQLNGIDEMIGIPNPNEDFTWTPSGIGNNNFSIEMFCNSEDGNGLYVSRPWNGNGEYNIQVGNTSFSVRVGDLVTSSKSVSYSTKRLQTYKWEHFCGTVTPTEMKVYRNGILFNTAQNTVTGILPIKPNQKGSLIIGSLFFYGNSWLGNTGFSIKMKLGNFKFYNRALSAEEVQQNYNAIKGRYGL